MKDFVITTDNTADLPYSYYKENGLEYMYLTYNLDGQVYGKENELPSKEFYARMRGGSMPTTSQINSEDAKEVWLPYLREGKAILHLAFSSGLSGSCNSARLAAEDLKEEHPEYEIIVIDSLCASLGEGLFVHKAVELKREGKSMEEIAQWLEEHKLNFCHVFTVDDLHHLYRGGRVSRATAVLGSMINIKPLLHVDDEGHLVAVGKVRGRKRSLAALVDMMEERLGSYKGKNTEIFISHGDCQEDAEYVAALVKERYGIEKVLINTIGATIGAHAGPGTVALFFLGDKR
ncbi:MAG TPA: DegV family protein [Candidatus Egerieimonas intestinavium]|uniref:DegV family protein n=1 Tax=Candidatus Egerieimonas intestinavium TaxID=2840777 RepID=A0A9D1EK67_9FIRM|nr:DegV family protein [Candidatus Egerieimonas intestinavium]